MAEAVIRRPPAELLAGGLGGGAVVAAQRVLDSEVKIVEPGVRELERLDGGACRRGHEHHAARPEGGLRHGQRIPRVFLEREAARIAHEQQPEVRVVPGHGLRVRRAGKHGHERERQSGIDESDRGLPRHRELAHQKAALLGPAPLAHGRGSVVADLLRDLQMRDRLAPELGDGGERGGRAGPVVLRDLWHGQELAPAHIGGSLDLVGDGLHLLAAAHASQPRAQRRLAAQIVHA